MEEKYFEPRGCIGSTGREAPRNSEQIAEENRLKEFLIEALKQNEDIEIPQPIIDGYIFRQIIGETCQEWTNQKILASPVIRKIFGISDWFSFSQQTKLFWETHEIAKFARITILGNAPRDSHFLDYLKKQENLSDEEKIVLYQQRVIYHHEVSVKELIRLGFLGTEFLKVKNIYLNIQRLIIENTQTSDDLRDFIRDLFEGILDTLRENIREDEDYIQPDDEKFALEAISVFNKFNLKIEKPKSWKKMISLIDDENLKNQLETIIIFS